MTITVSLVDLLVIVAGICLVVITVVAVTTGRRVRAMADETSATLRVLRPRAAKVLERGEDEMERIESISGRVDHIVERVDAVTTEASGTVIPLVRDAEQLRQSKDQVIAAVHGARAGLQALRGHR